MPYFTLGDFNADRQAALPVAAARRAAARLLARLVARHFERNLAAMTAGRLKPLDPQCKILRYAFRKNTRGVKESAFGKNAFAIDCRLCSLGQRCSEERRMGEP